MNMNENRGKRQNRLAQLLGLPENTNVNYFLNPHDNSIMKISWNSPNDGKNNMINFLMDTEPYLIRIKDNH